MKCSFGIIETLNPSLSILLQLYSLLCTVHLVRLPSVASIQVGPASFFDPTPELWYLWSERRSRIKSRSELASLRKIWSRCDSPEPMVEMGQKVGEIPATL